MPPPIGHDQNTQGEIFAQPASPVNRAPKRLIARHRCARRKPMLPNRSLRHGKGQQVVLKQMLDARAEAAAKSRAYRITEGADAGGGNRACGAVSPSTCSANVLAGQSVLSQRN